MRRKLKQSIGSFFSRKGGAGVENSGGEVEMLDEYYIPDYILVPDSEQAECSSSHIPECPVIVFVNTKSGGQLGSQMLVTYRSLLNMNQVFDLMEKGPEKVLHQLYFNLEKHKKNGDKLAADIQLRLRIIVAGGDGTAAWVLGVISDLKLAWPPPVATMPLGTGNNLPFSFGWGKKNPGTDYASVKAFLELVKDATEMKVDSWHVVMKVMRASRESQCDPIAPLELPNSLHAFKRVSSTLAANEEVHHTFCGGFWNYFSMGMDAQVSYAFHSERKLHPEKFNNQLVNQTTYAKLSCTQGWFCASLKHPSSRNIAQLANVKIMRTPGEWIDLPIPHSIRSIICLNLPSFSGGLNPWGRPSERKLHSRDLTPPYVNDGYLEVVGFRDAFHGLVLFAPNGHGTRLAQAHRIRFEFHKGAPDHTFMRMDGEPWKQPLPTSDNESVVIEISHFGKVSVLANKKGLTTTISSPDGGDIEIFEGGLEERKKLGAAESFKLPDDFSIAHV